MVDLALAARGLFPALAVAAVATPIARRAAIRLGAFDRPASHKSHHQPTPYFGGLSIFVGLLAGGLATGLWGRIPTIVFGALILVAVGVADDLWNLTWGVRIMAQSSAASLVIAGGLRPEITGVGVLDVAITLLWIVGITNAFNLLDNMDGLSSGVAGAAAFAFLGAAMWEGQWVTAALSASVIGAVLGFFPYNFPRARVFMGDAGSTLLGFAMAVLALQTGAPHPDLWHLAIPICVLAPALVDTTVVVFDRLRSGHKITWGGTDHISHRLVALGLSRRASVIVIVGATAALGAVGLLATRGSIPQTAPAAGAAVAAMAGVALLRVPVNRPAVEERNGVAVRGKGPRIIDLRVFDRPLATVGNGHNGNGQNGNGYSGHNGHNGNGHKTPEPVALDEAAVVRPSHAFTVDVEEWFHGIELPEEQWPSESRLEVGMDRLLSLLDARDVKATFFVLGAVAERNPRLVLQLADSGHEIACHSYRHRFVYDQTPDEFREDLRKAVGAIASATGETPRGYRAPYFSVRRDSMWALEVLAEEGFAYDSSVFPVRNPRYGIPGAPRRPEMIETPGGAIREVPMTPLRVLGANLPFSGGAYLRILPWWSQSLAWRAADATSDPVISYIHPWELDPEHPRINLPRRVAATHYARLRTTEPRLERLLSRYRFGRLDEVFGMSPQKQPSVINLTDPSNGAAHADMQSAPLHF